MSETATKPTLLDELQDQRKALNDDLDKLIDEREEAIKEIEAREGESDEEQRNADQASADDFRSAVEALEADITPLDARIEQQTKKAERRKNAVEGAIVQVINEPVTYRKDNANEHSYYRDLLSLYPLAQDLAPKGAQERIARHRAEMEERIPKRALERQRAAEAGIDEAEREFRSSFPGLRGSLEGSPFEKRVNPSRETGHGGEFVPPLWLVEDDFIPQLRAGRVIAPLCRNLPVPPGTDTIKLPKIKLGTEVAPQLMDNAGVASRDVTTTFVEAAVKTLAGQEDVAIQLIEQSPGQVFDRVVQEDLLADHNLKVEQAVSFGQGENYTTLNAGTIKGLYPTANWGAGHRVTTKTLEEYPLAPLTGLNANWTHIAKERFNTQNIHHVINPGIAGYLTSVTDGVKGFETGKLLVNATDFPNFNISGELAADTPAEGALMRTPLGPIVYHTANIPPILPMATTTETMASILFAADKESEKLITAGTELFSYGLTAKFDDVWFFESDLRTRVLPEVLSGTLQIRFQVYNYISLLVRYAPSVQFCGGAPFKVGTSFAAAPTLPALGGYVF